MIDFLTNNWYLIIGGIALLIFVVYEIVKFAKLSKENKNKKISAWLDYAVVQAEVQLGSETGKAKLGMVYDLFIEKFPIVSKFLSFEKFCEKVDVALDETKELIDKIKAVGLTK